jgi:uncharacterized protein
MTARPMSLAECRHLLRGKRVGRVVFTDRALPSALPVNYVLTDDGIVFRTDPASQLSRLMDGVGAVLGFEVDEVDEDLASGWSVLVVGLATRMPEDEAWRLDGAGLRSWGSENASTFVRIPIDRLTGRAVESLASATVGDDAGPVAGSRPVA